MTEAKITKTLPFARPPIRLAVQIGLAECLETITHENDYRHDLTGAVYRGRAFFGEEAPLPMVSILEAPIPPDQDSNPVGATTGHGPIEYVIQGFVQDQDKKNPTDAAHYLMAEVKQALAVEVAKINPARGRGVALEPNPFGLGGDIIESVDVGPGVVRPADDSVSSVAYFWLTLRIKVIEDWYNPFGENPSGD